MKYLKLYEAAIGTTFKTFLNKRYGSGFDEFDSIRELRCGGCRLVNLNGIENFINLENLQCMENKLTDLKGIENLLSLNRVSCYGNLLTGIKELENLVELVYLDCGVNNIKSLDGIQNLKKLRNLQCDKNWLENINEIEGLNLNEIVCFDNPFKEPIKKEILFHVKNDMGVGSIYDDEILRKFHSYGYQKKFLEERPERVIDLEFIGFSTKIKIEYKDLIEFFGIKI